jgi:hypothetical protein
MGFLESRSMMSGRFPPPWSIEDVGAAFLILVRFSAYGVKKIFEESFAG